jgi:hypothetical protein
MSPSADQAREQAREILAEERFHESELPRPLHGVLEWIGDRLEPIADAVGRAVGVVPGSDNAAWLLVAVLALVGALLVGLWLIRARGPGVSRVRPGHRADGPPDAATLELEADGAERAGDLERALRLRFRAGVLRLAERRMLEDPSSATTGALARRLRSEQFALAAIAFDEVVYGRRVPTTDDARLAREGWQAVLAR